MNEIRKKACSNFEEKKENKKEYYLEQAEKNNKLSTSIYNDAKSMAACIPFGQPILIGHHSEKRDRRFRERITNKFNKSIEASNKSEYYEKKANVNSNAILSDDPQAIIKLREKISLLEKRRDKYKLINKTIKKHLGSKKGICLDKGSQETEAIKKALKKDLEQICKSQSTIDQLMTPSYLGHYGIQGFSITSLTTKIREAKKRIAYMIEEEKREDINFKVNDVEVKEEEGRINIYFPDKPEEAFRKKIKSYPLSLKWSRWGQCWTRKKTANVGQWFIDDLKKTLKEY